MSMFVVEEEENSEKAVVPRVNERISRGQEEWASKMSHSEQR